MTLADFERQTYQILATDLTAPERAVALETLGLQIRRCAWSPWCQAAATALADRCETLSQEAAPRGSYDPLSALDSLVARGRMGVH